VTRALLAWYPEAFPGESLDAIEVSSPGIERPLRWPEHWRRFIGARVRLRSPVLPGRPVAVIRAVPDDDHVTLAIEGQGERTLAFDQIRQATLVVDWSGRD
jgi:ribosome maturation factor RimP